MNTIVEDRVMRKHIHRVNQIDRARAAWTRARQRQLQLALAGKVAESAHYAALASRVRPSLRG